MGKASKRKNEFQPANAGNVHEHIQAEAAQRRESPEFFMSEFMLNEPATDSALGGLFEAAREAAGNATPTKFMYEGRPYWLRACIGMALLEVFDKPATSKPLARALVGSTDKFDRTCRHFKGQHSQRIGRAGCAIDPRGSKRAG